MINELLYEWDSMKTKLWYVCARAEDECRYRWNLARVERLEKKKAATGEKTAAAEEMKEQEAEKSKKTEQQDCKDIDMEYIASKDVRDYLVQIGKKFTEEEIEALKYNVQNRVREDVSKTKYVFIPHPFRRGDICKRVNSDVLGVVVCPASKIEMYEQGVRRLKSCTQQMSIGVMELGKTGEFEHKLVPVDEIEYAKLEKEHPAKLLLEEARELMLGRGSIPCVQELQREYQEQLETNDNSIINKRMNILNSLSWTRLRK